MRATQKTDTLFASDSWGIRFSLTVDGVPVTIADHTSVEMNIRRPNGTFITKDLLSIVAGIGSLHFTVADTAGMSGVWEVQPSVDDATLSRYVFYAHKNFDGQ